MSLIDAEDEAFLSAGQLNQINARQAERAEFVVKDSGERESYNSGMVRDVEEGKVDYTLALDGPMFKRYAEHMTKGAEKYGRRNWQLARSKEEHERFKRSALRHLLQWLNGDRDEDHAAAVIFNLNAAEHTLEKLADDYDDRLRKAMEG